jgi:serine/threonine protein kinase
MTDRDDRIDRLYALALEQAPAARLAFVDAAAEDDDIKSAVRAVLEADDYAGDFLSGTAVDAAEEPPLPPGTTLGQYRIQRLIGRGGMGIVYEAQDTRLNRRVALKSLAPELSAESNERARLEREARAAAALTHPGIATVYALEEFDGHLFIASEFLDGETLRAEMSRGPMPAARVVDAGAQLAEALSAAHLHHVVHRDLKPENIIRVSSGALKILDFGLAQIVDPSDLISRTRSRARQRLTETGLIAGTPPYMSPEQLRGRPTDFRTDHFALGVLLYEATTGRHPFAGSSLDSVIAQILTVPPEPPRLPDEMPPAFWAVIERCLRKDPGERFASTPELSAALAAVKSELTAVSSSPRALSTAAAAPTVAVAAGDPSPLKWWRFHQLAAALAYWTMVWPAWIVHREFGRFGLGFFFALLAAIVIAGNLRLHLWFSSRVYPEDLPSRLDDVARWIRGADIAFAALLIVSGIALPPARAGWAAVLIAFGIGTALAAFIIEPATLRAAIKRR